MSHTVARIVTGTLASGGATFDADGNEIRSGVSVGGIVPAVRIPVRDFTPEALAAAVYFFEGHGTFGTWIEEGEVWIEPVTITATRPEGIALGRERGEIAVYDLDHGEEIRL